MYYQTLRDLISDIFITNSRDKTPVMYNQVWSRDGVFNPFRELEGLRVTGTEILSL